MVRGDRKVRKSGETGMRGSTFGDRTSEACFTHLSLGGVLPQTVPMDQLEQLRDLLGPTAKDWTRAQLEQLDRDMQAMAAILLNLYETGQMNHRKRVNSEENFDVSAPTD